MRLKEKLMPCAHKYEPGIALLNTLEYYPDFLGDNIETLEKNELRGLTMSYTGKAKLVKVLKCKFCGHSKTVHYK